MTEEEKKDIEHLLILLNGTRKESFYEWLGKIKFIKKKISENEEIEKLLNALDGEVSRGEVEFDSNKVDKAIKKIKEMIE